MDKLYVIKIGGEVIDNSAKLDEFLRQFALIGEKKILVHGGGKVATELAAQLGIPQQMLEGRRVTDAETLKVVTMVYGGLINKQLVAALQARATNAIGLTGADGNLALAHKRVAKIDYGFAGDIDAINKDLLGALLGTNVVPVIAPLSHDGKGQMLNTNADTMAKAIASALTDSYEVHLVYSFGKRGVLRNADDDSSVIPTLNMKEYEQLKNEKLVFAGMIPKLDNAFDALKNGIQKLSIGQAGELLNIIEGRSGTNISNE